MIQTNSNFTAFFGNHQKSPESALHTPCMAVLSTALPSSARSQFLPGPSASPSAALAQIAKHQPLYFSIKSLRVAVSITDREPRRIFSVTKASSVDMEAVGKGHGEGKREVKVFDSEEEMAVSLAEYTAELSKKFTAERDVFTVALSGGSLIKSMRKLLVPPYIGSVDWAKWHVFWADERVVPKDHEDSNYKLAYDGFLSKVPIPAEHVHGMNDALAAEGAADDYERLVKNLVARGVVNISVATKLPKFDLMLLGMGPDGHVASLFPGHPLVKEKEKWVTFIKDSPKPPPERITLTFPVINSCAHVAVVAAGTGKADAVHLALGHRQDHPMLPVQMISPMEEMAWFLDQGAASKL